MKRFTVSLLALVLSTSIFAARPAARFVPLFNGHDFSGWKLPVGDNGHWKVLDGVIDYDARSEATGSKDLWTDKEYRNFVLRIDWRIKETTGLYNMPTVLPDGSYKKGPDGKDILTPTPNADSGIYLRGSTKAQINIWCWPIGSGEVYGYRMDKKMPASVRAGVTPKLHADNPVGEWNSFEITLKGDRLTVVLNGKTVIEGAQLPDIPEKGPLGLQHHGGFKDGKYSPASSLMQFRNISIREL
ncbi:MAG: DUF1080 domain-containing protein [Opitutaceae bacterium]|nr:DUF1080 domain-containing protein [Opitutaceae bacterium]